MTSAFRAAALSLAIAAMLLRAMVPAGWMPETGAPGAMILCPGMGPMHSMPHRGHMDPAHGTQLCPYAAVAHLAPPQFWSPTAVPIVRVPDAPSWHGTAFVSLARPTGNHAPRAPPLTA